MHQQFELNVTGRDGTYEAVLTYGDTFVAGFDAKSIKDAQRRAREEGIRFLNENRPARVERHTEHFSL